MTRASFTVLAYQWAVSTPLLLAYLVGLIVAFVGWARNPRASLLAACGFLLMALVTLGAPVLFLMLVRLEGGNEVVPIATLFSFTRSFLLAVGLGLVILALRAGGSRPASAPPGP
jgi:hypothetical protein